jgi:diguanylate cyclase (GGDEF)-like protein/PAS domain S-box-containing protein
VPPGFQLLVLARIKMQAEQGVPVPLVEEKFLKLDGSVMDVEVQAAPITYEGKQAFQVAIRDITDRKKAKFALEESRARFQALSEASFEAIFISEKGKCLEQNSRAREMFGYSDAEAHGRPGTDWIAPENRDLVLKNMLSGYDLPYNVNGLRKDGTTFPSVIHGRTMHYKGAEVRVTSMRDVTEIRQAEEAMQQSTERLQSVVDAIPDLLFEMDLAGRYHAYFSPRTDLLIAPVQELIGKLIPDVMEPDAAAIVMAALQEANEREYSRGHVISLQTPIGQKWFELSIARKRTRANELPRFVVLSRDVTERKRSEQALLESEERFRSVMENIPGVAVQGYAMDGTVMFWNRAAEALYGYNADEALGGNLIDLIIPQEMHDGVREAMHSMAESGVAIPAGELLLKSKTGARIPVFSSHALLKPSSGEPELFCLDIDLTERKKLEEQVRQLAFYDALTQLPNRRLLDDRLTQVMAASRRTGFFGALMFLDLDNFKPLNDTQGHAVGDLLLMEVAKRLVSCVRESDTVARFGGDEFVVLIGELNISSSESNVQATAVAEKIRLILEKPFVLQIPEQGDKAAHTVEHHCSASIGVVLFKNPQDSQTDIVKKADWALYQAKSAGRNTVRFFALPDTSPA